MCIRRGALRLGGAVAALAAGLLLMAGCGGDDPAAPPGDSTGTTTGAPDGQQPATPGATDPGSGTTGGGGGGGTGTAAVKACQLVSAAEAQSALGAAVTTASDSAEACTYKSGTSTVDIGYSDDAYDPAIVAGLVSMGPMVKKLDGIGDAALQVSLGAEAQFHVWIKGKYLVIVVDMATGDTAAAGRALLDKALTRI